MRKIKAWQHSRKLALGIAFALGCSMAVSASAQVIEAPITGDAAVDTAYKDFIELNGSTPYYAFDKDATIKVDSSVNTPLQFTANGNTYDVAAGIAASAPEGVDNLASNASAIWIYGNVNVNVSENKKAADLICTQFSGHRLKIE